MLPTFVIGLREGLEAALIVGIIAAFLRKQGRRDLLRAVLAGVAGAALCCAAVGIALELYSRDLPQRQQEGLETVIGALAVAMVTYMVVWMRRHSRELKGQLEGLAAQALTGRSGAGRAMIVMAFLAVIREGLETVVFLLAAFNESGSGAAAGCGAVLGLAVAIALGYGIYRGGVRLNLSRFFRATGLVLVLVAAGLVVNALHTAHEAGWLDVGQGRTIDLSWLVRPGTVQSSLLTGMLGIQPHPVTIELLGWLAYLIPVGLYVGWPPGRRVPARALARGATGTALVAALAAVGLALGTPDRPAQRPTTAANGIAAQVLSRTGSSAEVRTTDVQPIVGTTGARRTVRLASDGVVRHRSIAAEQFRAVLPTTAEADRPATLTGAQVAALNGGRLPIGLPAGSSGYPVEYRDVRELTVWLDTRTDRVLDVRWTESTSAVADGIALATPVARASAGWPGGAVDRAVREAHAGHDALDRRALLRDLTTGCLTVAGLAVVTAVAGLLIGRTHQRGGRETEVVGVLIHS